ncbi:MAG: 16S rRNA (adenine(1518)-N(6)/adenine(1519)-N(6))-dimethyltransferase RsmA [Burkholderiales bacterium]|nr:16S rRNA (adenine(1518)-N(6)/adenine(1519)-N(6))-dimethyltransferase RsmA [Anaerolineae bacterium]
MNPKALLDEYEIIPKKSLGQNFLHDPNTLDKIVASAELSPDDTVVEVGPGTGTLTERLAEHAKRVIAIEIDERLKPILDEEIIRPYPNVWVIYQDVLTVDVAKLVYPDSYVVVANVPYYITSAILRHLLEPAHRPRRLVLTVQQEVAERIVAKPGDLSMLAVSVQFYGQARIISRLNPAIFWPRPDVSSAVVRIDTYETPLVDVPNADAFFRMVHAGFGQKRKQLKNAVASGLNINGAATTALLEQAGIDPRRRAETLTLQEWAALSRAYALPSR